MKNEKIYTISELAIMFSVHENSVRRWINLNKLESIRIGGMIRVTEEQLQKFVKKNSGV
ncbi:MAG: helix-turn-helix domain-containing protein [Clostridia bacterium]|jgi:excisionase family DNA binding protein|nr:helix-turn-helix domain-containing protein [Clostridia bacterium]